MTTFTQHCRYCCNCCKLLAVTTHREGIFRKRCLLSITWFDLLQEFTGGFYRDLCRWCKRIRKLKWNNHIYLNRYQRKLFPCILMWGSQSFPYVSGPQPFCSHRLVNNWQFYRGPGVLHDGYLEKHAWSSTTAPLHLQYSLCTQQCFHGKNRPITCPESEWCHHQYTLCNFAARYQLIRGFGTTALCVKFSQSLNFLIDTW